MTQMIIIDNAQVNRLKLDYENPVGLFQPSYMRNRRNRLYKLRQAIYEKPFTERDNHLPYTVITFLAHHKSNRPFIRRVYRARRKSNSEWMAQIDSVLKRIFKLYHTNVISGDLVIHKTAERSGTEFEQWPLVYKRRANYECWFVTGMTQWVEDLNSFAHSIITSLEHDKPDIRSQSIYQATEQIPFAQKQMMLFKQKLSPQIVGKERTENDFYTLFKRAEWVKIIRKHFNPILWSELIWDGTPRAGICIYVKGRAYWTQMGRDKCNWYVKEHSSRVFQPPLSVWFNSDSDDPDFLGRYLAWCNKFGDLPREISDMYPESEEYED